MNFRHVVISARHSPRDNIFSCASQVILGESCPLDALFAPAGTTSMRVVGDRAPGNRGSYMYSGGGFGADGRLYLPPSNAARAACFDPSNNTWELVGPTFREGDKKWNRPAMSSVDDCLYACPRLCAYDHVAKMLQIDTRNGTVQTVGGSVLTLEGIAQHRNKHGLYGDSVAAADGCIYGVPQGARRVLRFDPRTKKLSTFGELGGHVKYEFGVVGPNGRFIFCIPQNAARVLCIDTETQTCEFIGDDFRRSQSKKWMGAALGGDGSIYCIPACESMNRILRIDPLAKTTMLVGPPLRVKKGWFGAVAGTDGCVYGVPYQSTQVLRVDPFAQTVLTVGDEVPDHLHAKLATAVVGPDSAMWCIPVHPPCHILRVETVDPARHTTVLKTLRQPENHEFLRQALADPRHVGPALAAVLYWEATRADGNRALVTELLEVAAPALPACVLSDKLGHLCMVELLVRAISLSMPEAQVDVVGGAVPGKEGQDVYVGGAFGPDGWLYIVPSNASHVARFDPRNETWELFGESLTEGGVKWCSAALSRVDGCLYAFPGECTVKTRVLKIDTSKGTVEEVGASVLELAGDTKQFPWRGPIEGADGCIYCCPRNAASVLRFDPRTHELSALADIGSSVVSSYLEGVLGPDGRFIFCIPASATRVLCVDTLTQTCELIGEDQKEQRFKWRGGSLAGDGKIYCVPLHHKRVLCIDPLTKTTSLLGPTIDGPPAQWVSGGTGADGCVYCTPFKSDQFLMIDPFTQSVRKVGTKLPHSLHKTFNGVVRGPDDELYCVPNRLPARLVRLTAPSVSLPLKALGALISHPGALQRCLFLESLRNIFVPILLKHVSVEFQATKPASAAKPPQNSSTPKKQHKLAVAQYLSKDWPGLLEGLRATRELPMESDRLGFVSHFALSSATRLAPDPHTWNPVPASVQSWSWPPAPLAPLRAACKIAEASGPEGVEVAWSALSKTISGLLITIVDAVRADLSRSTKLLRAVFDRERMRSLETYRKQLRRARRDPTYPEFKGVAQCLSHLCKEHNRQKHRVQTIAFFPKLYATASSLADRFHDFLEDLSRRCAGSTSLKAPIKGCGRALEKLVLRPGWPERLKTGDVANVDARNLVDVLRGSIECPDFTDITYVLEILKQLDVDMGDPEKAKAAGIDLDKFQIFLIRINDRFTTPTSGGWADCMINFRFAHGDDTQHVIELQLQHRQMLVVRKEGKAHNQYNSFRSAFELLETVGQAPCDSFEEKDADQSPLDLMHMQIQAMERRLTQVEDHNRSLQRQLSEYREENQILLSKLRVSDSNAT